MPGSCAGLGPPELKSDGIQLTQNRVSTRDLVFGDTGAGSNGQGGQLFAHTGSGENHSIPKLNGFLVSPARGGAESCDRARRCHLRAREPPHRRPGCAARVRICQEPGATPGQAVGEPTASTAAEWRLRAKTTPAASSAERCTGPQGYQSWT